MLRIVPMSVAQAKRLVKSWHRHLPDVQGGLFAAGVEVDGELRGVAVAGNPARVWQGTGRLVISRVADGRGTTGAEKCNRRSVWTITPRPFKGAHFAVFPPDLAELCILAGSRPGDVVLDPFSGAGTTALVAQRLHRGAIGCELNPAYCDIAARRLDRAMQQGRFAL